MTSVFIKKNLYPLSLFILCLVSCEKKTHCDNAELRVKNNTADTIFFSYTDGSGYGDTLPPGGTVSNFYGSIDIDDKADYMIVNFFTPQANYAIPLDGCLKEKVID